MTHYEETLQRDIDRIKRKVTESANLAVVALNSCLQALSTSNRQIAYSVILKDQRIDELEKEIDRLCLEFIVRQQPVARTLRFAYAAIKINADIERVGDYAESIARHILALSSMNPTFPLERFAEIANRSVPMLQDAVKSFVTQDVEAARTTIEVEDIVDVMRDDVNAELVNLHKAGSLPLDALSPLMAIINRLERVSDQAKSICQEVIYMCTGEYSKHMGGEAFRLLFVDEHNHCRSQMAEAIGNSLGQSRFVFSSAGLDPQPIDRATLNYMKTKGFDLSRQTSKGLGQIPHLDQYQIIVALAKEAHRAFPPAPTKVVALDWSVPDPSAVTGDPAEVKAAFDRAFEHLRTNMDALIEAMIGEKMDRSN